MARARNLKPAFFHDAELLELNFATRLLFAGLWCYADREGRLVDHPKQIKLAVFPGDDVDVPAMLSALADGGFIERYQANGKRLIQIRSFAKHQNPHYKEPPSELPAPPGYIDSGKTGGAPDEALRQAVFDRDGRRCVGCGSSDDLTLDHIVPRSKGGTHDKSNLQTLCRKCNAGKNNREARSIIGQSSANDRLMIPGLAPESPGRARLIPDSLNLKKTIVSSADANDTPPSKTVKYSAGFEAFWQAWPLNARKRGKGEAYRAWKRQRCEPLAAEVVRDVLLRATAEEQWKNGYCPMPSTYLSGRRWEDPLPAAPAERRVSL